MRMILFFNTCKKLYLINTTNSSFQYNETILNLEVSQFSSPILLTYLILHNQNIGFRLHKESFNSNI